MPPAMDGWHLRIGGYCERTSDAFWAEPLNALTNLAFLGAACAAFVWARRASRRGHGGRDLGVDLLIGITVAIGIGSFLFHTLATPLAALADVLPILLFIVVYLALVCRRFFALAWSWSVLIGLAYLPLSIGGRLFWRQLAGGGSGATGGYLPAILLLLAVAALLARRRHPAALPLALAAPLFALSLVFRTLDLPLCASLPTGTHFIWHLLNAALLALLLRTMLHHGASGPQSVPAGTLRRRPSFLRRT